MQLPDLNPVDEFTEVRPSPIHGLGVFSRVDIPAGTVWWRGGPGDVILIDQRQYETLTASSGSPVWQGFLETLQTYSYYSPALDALVLILDNARYTNHSEEPNSGLVPGPETLASMTLRDIRAGEEITEDYRTYGDCPWCQHALLP